MGGLFGRGVLFRGFTVICNFRIKRADLLRGATIVESELIVLNLIHQKTDNLFQK